MRKYLEEFWKHKIVLRCLAILSYEIDNLYRYHLHWSCRREPLQNICEESNSQHSGKRAVAQCHWWMLSGGMEFVLTSD